MRQLFKKFLLFGAIIGGFNPYMKTKASTNQPILNEIHSEEDEFYSVDYKAPEVKSIKVDKNVVKPGEVVKLSVDVIDDLSTIQTVQVVYQEPISKNSKSLFLEYNSETGLYESVISVDEATEVGEWIIDYILILDKKGNSESIQNDLSNYEVDLRQGKFTVLPSPKAGWLKEGAIWYYVKDDGTFLTGWLQEGNKWYYLKSSGAMVTGWEKVNGKWYYLNLSGVMQTGWIQEGNKWYYLYDSGAMATGWAKVNGKWYYLNSSGVMQTGWIQEGNKWYYLYDSGAMATGWAKVNGKWYYLNSSGVMQTGWIQEGNKWYYLCDSGAMAIGWAKVNGKWYYLNSSGVMQTGWIQEGNKWYYLKSSGAMVIGVEKIEGTYYYFNSAGVMQKNLGSIFDINKYNQLISSGKSPSYALNYVLHPNVKTNFYKDIRVLKDPSSLTTLVNKNFRLPSNYVPADLVLLDVPLYNNSPSNLANYMRSEAAVALKNMFNTAQSEKGYKLVARSGYRSYKTQETLYNNYVSTKGQVWADTYSARPGHSEHQTGLAIDITSPTVNNSLSDSFGTTAEGKWVAQNAHRFGYILRYPQGRQSEVGYEYEPWHLRYVGVEIATEIYNSGLIYEDYVLEKGLIPSV
ncbi:MAG: D-alanyl-D-alanine carboxypeptidase family protein [Turicibacter sp.]|nr:D-alanyl-D-alanine carboxypeptidase family protein [Turicibacter sp.]